MKILFPLLTYLFGFTLVFVACATSPTGRKQIRFLPESEINQMGAQAFSEMKAKTPIEKDLTLNTYVRCVALAITSLPTLRPAATSWEIVVFKDATANAFALPGGKIGVYTGLLKVATTAGQLGAVIGHEIGHVIAQHANERTSQAILAEGGLTLIGGTLLKDHPYIMAALGLGTQVGILLPFGRKQESESDLIGLELMSEAGFDPHDSIKLWQNMIVVSQGAKPPIFLSTHPPSELRIQDLEKHLPQALILYDQALKQGRSPKCTL